MGKDDAPPPARKAKPERRRSPRSTVVVRQIRVEDGRKTFLGHLHNLSRSGLFVATMNAPKKGSELEVEFALPDSDRVVRCTCQVVWRRLYSPAARFTPGMGLRFVDLDFQSAAAIRAWADQATSQDG
ncbi:MAG TPA: PilZ domain-containing protein [Myxococcota bacterium]|nr:PilZ domain-containing protein [Myxococcota bacterium]HRY93393.1 PilZ domain-containing protein [Myxococcota bacterium]HSA20381.1 PilZ domain-containing protein [Myxococcota bacterium]